MLPVTRANLDHICCICLLDVRPSVFTEKVYDVRKERNISKVLKLTAYMTILKNPINQKYISDYCRKICEMCFIKIQYSYTFREKIVASTITLKELLENNLNEMDIENLQSFCRICLNRQKGIKKGLETMPMNWLKDCSGIRFTSFIDKEIFRIKEGTNINEIAVIDDKQFPKELCRSCLRKLKNVDDFRKSATHAFDYMISVMGDAINQEDHLMNSEIKTFKQNIYENTSKLETELINYNQDKWNSANVKICMDPLINARNFMDMLQFENNTMDTADSICHYSDSSKIGNNLNSHLNDSDDGIKSNHSLKNARIKNTKQNDRISKCNEEETNGTEIVTKKQHKRSKRVSNLNENKEKIEITNFKNGDCDKVKETFVCEECCKKFSSKCSLRKHKGIVHFFDPAKMLECIICLKQFKRKSHLEDHIKSVHEKLKPFKCSYCAKTFTANNTKRVHELGHTGDFPCVCNFCGKGFRRSHQLKIHLDIHTTTSELLCPICKMKQRSETDLQNHLKIHSDNRGQCAICGKSFSRNSHLIDHHNAVHLKLRPFKCSYCELAFGDRKTRSKHEKLHTDDRPLKCSVCTIGFKNQSSLNRHTREFGHVEE